MGRYNNSFREPSSAERKKLWNPSEVVGIVNTDPGYQYITCIGYAPSQRRRCRNRIAADKREFIMATLNEIAYLRPDSPTVASRLREIAVPALCGIKHRDQAEAVIRKWQENIKQVKPYIGEQIHTKPVQSTKKQDVKPDQALVDAYEQLREMRRSLTELEEELKKQRHQDQGYEGRERHVAKDRQEEERKRRERERQGREDREREAKRQESERKEKERREKEEEERMKEQQEKERQEKEQHAREQKAGEQAAYNERIRQKAQKVREERERKERERAQTEREEWDRSWAKYQDRWVIFRASAAREGNVRNAIPWPVKSGSYNDVVASAVEEFMQMAVPRDTDMAKLMRKECQKWHPDVVNGWLRGAELTEVDRMMVGMICRVVTEALNKAAGRSSEFLD